MNNLEIVERRVAALVPHARNARTHSKKQIKQIAESISRFGWTNPVRRWPDPAHDMFRLLSKDSRVLV